MMPLALHASSMAEKVSATTEVDVAFLLLFAGLGRGCLGKRWSLMRTIGGRDKLWIFLRILRLGSNLVMETMSFGLLAFLIVDFEFFLVCV